MFIKIASVSGYELVGNMKIALIDNAVDSLQIAMNTFELWNQEFESRNDVRYLKITIEFLHNTVELLMKAILSQDDEKSIYCAENERQRVLVKKAEIEAENQKISLMEYVIKSNEIKTLTYNDLLKRCIEKGILCEGRAISSLEKLGIYRNRIMHLGMDVTDDFADLLAVIYENFKLVIDDKFYHKLIKLSDYFSYNDVLDTIEPWQELNGDALRLLSTEIEKRKLKIFDEMIKNVINSKKFMRFLDQNNISFENNSIYQEDYIDIEFQCNGKQVEFTTMYDAFYNYTVIVSYYFEIIFCVMHFENEIAVCKNWIEYDELVLESIHDKKAEMDFVIKPLTENNIRNCLIDTLKKTILCSIWENEYS